MILWIFSILSEVLGAIFLVSVLEVPDIANLRFESFYELIVLRQIVCCTSNSPRFVGEFSELPFLPVTKGV